MIKEQSKVVVHLGRNNGEIGTVIKFSDNRSSVYVDFNRLINVNEGFGSLALYPDAYWIPLDFVSET